MRALEPDVFDAVWAAVEPLLPARPGPRPTRSAATGVERPTEPAFERCSSGW